MKHDRQPLLSILGAGTRVRHRDQIEFLDTDGTVGVWSPTMDDLLADDDVAVRLDGRETELVRLWRALPPQTRARLYNAAHAFCAPVTAEDIPLTN